MKVLSIVTNQYSPFYQNQIKALEEEGCDITHLSPGDQSESYQEQQSISRTHFDYFKLYPDILKEPLGEYDIIHANNGKVAPFALGQLSCPVVLTFWGTDLMERYQKMCRICSRFADEVIVPSPAMSPYLPVDHSVIPFGVDPSVFRPIEKEEARSQLGWDQEKTIVLFPYPKSRSIKRFDLAKRIVRNLDADICLQSVSGIPHESMPVYMNASDSLLVTSRRESGPMVIKEAALCNVPVVSTDVGFAEQVLSRIENSYVSKTEEELEHHLQCVLDDSRRSDGREKLIDTIGLSRMANRILDVYNRSIDNQ
ncbi:group 1 glycosyl transferase [Halovivax asiaticus JCM 14624]|uniref:Group 1 glycosyl transferase n=1 Tax=Halovivax asiaticus JCM 14624 TaxID=1227490 RepID=M0BJT9_9EURY|nr:glycosyltransferase family 4 protein [Halovivax asiaticus]ELZ11156.1 group 1 glycosyl transferase [Halovivax asiaticus JCM 14624]